MLRVGLHWAGNTLHGAKCGPCAQGAHSEEVKKQANDILHTCTKLLGSVKAFGSTGGGGEVERPKKTSLRDLYFILCLRMFWGDHSVHSVHPKHWT